jgi:phosphoribosylanthranilate isomerase
MVSETPEIAAVQLHGKETPAEVAAFAARHPLTPIVKALGIAARRDLELIEEYTAADAFLLDAKAPAGAKREGGFGRTFDWSILKGLRTHDHEDWTLSGGLTPDNVAEAIRISGAFKVDVSSGVEASPGVKDTAKIKAFIEAAKGAG